MVRCLGQWPVRFAAWTVQQLQTLPLHKHWWHPHRFKQLQRHRHHLSPPRLVARLAVQTSPRSITRRLPGQIDPNQALIEARAKISWGDEPVEVVKFLMIQCFSREEAKEHVWEMFAERVKAVRSNGVGKSSSASAWPACPSLDCSCSCCWDSSCSRFLRS